MDAILKDRQMEGAEPLAQAKRALGHVLSVMRSNPTLAYYMGPGSQAFSLVTEAAATLFGEPVEQVREGAINREARDPAQGRRDLIEACQRVAREYREDGDISIGAVEDCESALKAAEGKE